METKYRELVCLNNGSLFPPSSGDWESKIMVLVGLVSLEASLLDLQMAILPCVLTQVLILYLILWSLLNATCSWCLLFLIL